LQNRTGFPVTRPIKNKSSEHQLLIAGILADHYGLSTHIKKQEKPGLGFFVLNPIRGKMSQTIWPNKIAQVFGENALTWASLLRRMKRSLFYFLLEPYL
jgi:hypothetical protein